MVEDETVYVVSKLSDATKKDLEDQGFSFPERPSDEPTLPVDVTTLTDDDLMHLYSLFVAWTDYAAAQMAMAMVTEHEMERSLAQAEAIAWGTIGAKASVSAAKASVQADKAVIFASAKYEKARAYRRLITELADRYERDASLLSRELTRRTSDRPRRKERWT